MELNEETLDGIYGGPHTPYITEEEKKHIYERCNGDFVKAEAVIKQLQQQRQDEYIRESVEKQDSFTK